MTLTRTGLVKEISEHGLPTNKSSEILESVLEIMKETLESGEDIMISGFGKFCVKEKNKRRGRNPATGDELFLDARRVVTFQCSGVLRERMNAEG